MHAKSVLELVCGDELSILESKDAPFDECITWRQLNVGISTYSRSIGFNVTECKGFEPVLSRKRKQWINDVLSGTFQVC